MKSCESTVEEVLSELSYPRIDHCLVDQAYKISLKSANYSWDNFKCLSSDLDLITAKSVLDTLLLSFGTKYL